MRDNSSIRVLIVEDDPVSRKVLADYVTVLGHEPIEADNGLLALAIAGSQKVDVILLDAAIRDVDASEVLHRIKTNVSLRHIPVMVTAVRSDKESIARYMELNADDHVVKPVDPALLGARLTEILAKPRKQTVPRKSLFASLTRMGVGRHFVVAATLISLLPTLALGYIFFASNIKFAVLDTTTRWAVAMILLVAVAGYVLLLKYPISIVRLRHYLAMLAKGNFPEEIDISKEEDDLKAIGSYMSSIIEQTQGRIRTIEEQAKSLVEAEAQRVMIESLGAACHHIGQPATVINTYLSMMREREKQPEMQAMIEECQKASNDLRNVLERLQNVSLYRTEPYRPSKDSEPPRSDEKIVKINK